MPTGYTADIIDGKIKTFPEFAKLCMRAFGATIHMRDDGIHEKYVPRIPSEYHLEQIKKLKKSISDMLKLPADDLVKLKVAELNKNLAWATVARDKALKNMEVIKSLLSEVNDWQPPTKEHNGLKDFMIQQLQSTMEHDGDTSYYDKYLKEIAYDLKTIDAAKLRDERLKQEKKDLAYHTKEYAAEIKRCRDSNKWVKDLISSLKY